MPDRDTSPPLLDLATQAAVRVTAAITAPAVTVGPLSGRAAASADNAGQMYYASDQVSLSISTGASWLRVGPAACGDIIWTNESSARTGYLLLAGQTWASVGTTGIYAELYALWGSPANLPDVKARAMVAVGTNRAILANDGVTEGNRFGLRHRHTNHSHSDTNNALSLMSSVTGSTSNVYAKGGSSDLASNNPNAAHSHDYGAADGGSGVAADPLDGGAYIVFQPQVKL